MTRLINYYNNLNKILDEDERELIIRLYNDWVSAQPSIVDGDSDVSQPHHIRTAGNSGVGIKPNDLWQVPITYSQHQKAHSSKHYTEMKELFLSKIEELHERFMGEVEYVMEEE